MVNIFMGVGIMLLCMFSSAEDDHVLSVQLQPDSMITELPVIATASDAAVEVQTNEPLEASRIELEENTEEMHSSISNMDSESSDEVSEVISEALIYDGYEDAEIILFTEPEEPQEPTLTYLGTYQLTAYAWTGNRCANGNYPTLNYTIASNSIPMGSRVYIEGYGEFVVEDTGGMSSNVIDVYMGDYSTCIQFGRRTANVYLIN